jgi:hypothetical protein
MMIPCILCEWYLQCEHFPPSEDCPIREESKEAAPGNIDSNGEGVKYASERK